MVYNVFDSRWLCLVLFSFFKCVCVPKTPHQQPRIPENLRESPRISENQVNLVGYRWCLVPIPLTTFRTTQQFSKDQISDCVFRIFSALFPSGSNRTPPPNCTSDLILCTLPSGDLHFLSQKAPYPTLIQTKKLVIQDKYQGIGGDVSSRFIGFSIQFLV